MSEYFLADVRAEERARRRAQELELQRKQQEPTQPQDVKITLLGDFLFPSSEPQGFDPYNSSGGMPVHEAWKSVRSRR